MILLLSPNQKHLTHAIIRFLVAFFLSQNFRGSNYSNKQAPIVDWTGTIKVEIRLCFCVQNKVFVIFCCTISGLECVKMRDLSIFVADTCHIRFFHISFTQPWVGLCLCYNIAYMVNFHRIYVQTRPLIRRGNTHKKKYTGQHYPACYNSTI